jgi:hypothetical protein
MTQSTIFECSIGEEVSLLPAVREQLSVDACARTFVLGDVHALDSVRCLLSGGAVSIAGSQTGLGLQLHNSGLEMELAFVAVDCFDLNSVDFSMFSVEALDEVLASGSFSIVSEDFLLMHILSVGEKYHPLMRWIDLKYLRPSGLVALAEDLEFSPKWVWSGIADHFISHRLDSLIISDCPKPFAEFRGKRFSLLLCGSRDGFVPDAFDSYCECHVNTLTVIMDTDRNIFGGFTPVAWESQTTHRGRI